MSRRSCRYRYHNTLEYGAPRPPPYDTEDWPLKLATRNGRPTGENRHDKPVGEVGTLEDVMMSNLVESKIQMEDAL